MKKIYVSALAICMGAFSYAQTIKVEPAGTGAKPKEEVKKEVDPHAGHNHGPVVATPTASDVAKPIMEDNLTITETAYNFGKIPQGKPVTHDFEIVNSGKTELKIENVQASCGCTTPVWKPGPYKAGEKSTITVGYNAAAAGQFSKTVTVTYNNGMSKVITISGEVWQAPATPAPENKSVQILKNGN